MEAYWRRAPEKQGVLLGGFLLCCVRVLSLFQPSQVCVACTPALEGRWAIIRQRQKCAVMVVLYSQLNTKYCACPCVPQPLCYPMYALSIQCTIAPNVRGLSKPESSQAGHPERAKVLSRQLPVSRSHIGPRDPNVHSGRPP